MPDDRPCSKAGCCYTAERSGMCLRHYNANIALAAFRLRYPPPNRKTAA